MILKIGFDVHGVVDTLPEFFGELSSLLVENGHEAHILTGSRQSEIEDDLKKRGMLWTHFFSISDHHERGSTKVWYGPDGTAWMDTRAWESSKAQYAKLVGLHMHFDDSDRYGKYFETPYARLFVKGMER